MQRFFHVRGVILFRGATGFRDMMKKGVNKL